jgi:hypothetical protein
MQILRTIGRRLRGVAALVLLGLVVAGCGQPAATPTQPVKGALVPVLAVSELTVGPNRIALGVLQDGTPINDPGMKLPMRFYYLDGDTDDKVAGESTAVYRGEGLPFGLYVGYVTFDKPGAWTVEIGLPQASGEPVAARMRLDVLETPVVPPVGTNAVPSQNLTVKDEPDLTKITSDATPDPDFYQLTITDAIAAKKPFVAAFSTPGYCQTAVCAPNMQVLKKLKAQYKDKLNFIHVEVYPYPFGESFKAQRRVPSMVEWGLRTEPWTFLVDAEGRIQARYEGGITFTEMDLALAQLAAGEPVTPPVQ